MSIDVSLTLNSLVPAAQYGGSLTANTQEAFDAITWEDERAKPTWQDILDAASSASAVDAAIRRIQEIEAEITPRRHREATFTPDVDAGGGLTARQWMDEKMADLAAQRAIIAGA